MSLNLLALDSRGDEPGQYIAVIESPRGCRNKYKYDPERGLFELSGVLPNGSVFPFDLGFIPSTVGGDGDPLDVLVLMDEPAFPGCVLPVRIIGVIRAMQTEKGGKRERNDRLIAVALKSHEYGEVRSIKDVNKSLVREIEHFFVSYNMLKGKPFEVEDRLGPRPARQVVEEGIRAYRESNP